MKNSWTLSQTLEDNYIHNYFCTCTNKFTIKTNSDEIEAPDVLCPKCGNDYFIDAKEWESGTATKIWKQFFWEREECVNANGWSVELYFKIPRFSDVDSNITLERQKLLGASLSQKAGSRVQFQHSYPVSAKYSLYSNEKVQEVKKLLIQDAKEYLFQNFIDIIPSSINWIQAADLKVLNIDESITIYYFYEGSCICI